MHNTPFSITTQVKCPNCGQIGIASDLPDDDGQVSGAHGAGFLPSYSGRVDANCEFSEASAKRCKALKKKPSDYMKEQLISDSLVFNSEELLLRVRKFGVSQVVLGTDHPAPWPTTGVDHVLETPGLSDDEKFAILGGNLSKLLRIPQFDSTTT